MDPMHLLGALQGGEYQMVSELNLSEAPAKLLMARESKWEIVLVPIRAMHDTTWVQEFGNERTARLKWKMT